MLRKYSMQLFDHGIDYYALTKEITKEEKVKAFEEARKQLALNPERPILDYKSNVFTLKMPFEHKDLAKGIDKHYWDNEKKVWCYHTNSRGVVEGLYDLIQSHKELGIIVKPAAAEYIDTYFKDKAQFDGAVKQVVHIKENGVPDIPVPLKDKTL